MSGNAMDDTRRCTARSKQSGEQCKRFATPGGKTCVMHGSSTRKAQAKAKRVRDEAKARAAVVTYGLPMEISPADALLQEVHRTAGHVAWLHARIHDFDPDDLTWGVTSATVKTTGQFPGTDTTTSAAPPVLLELYARERKHLVDVCAAALRAGVDERRVRLAEQQGDLLATVIQAILTDLKLTAAQQKLVPTVVPRHLRAVAGGGG